MRVNDVMHKLTVSQFFGIQSQTQGLSIYCINSKLFSSSFFIVGYKAISGYSYSKIHEISSDSPT